MFALASPIACADAPPREPRAPAAPAARAPAPLPPPTTTPAAVAPAPADASALAGTWSMDLSPQQNGSYLKDLVVEPTPGPHGRGQTFTGTVYGGSTFDNGQSFVAGGRLVFSFVSDEARQLGGPYYWLGALEPDGALRGRVQSLSRKLEMRWEARKKGAAPKT